MKKKKLFILFTILFLTIFVSITGINAAELTDEQKEQIMKENRDAILNTAEAYFAQGEQIQYDSYKKNLNCTPEDATSKHYCYFNCATFTYAVFKEALGKEIPHTTDGLLNYANCLANGNDSSDCQFKNPKGINVTAKGKVIGYSSDLKLSGDEDESYTKLLSKFLKQKFDSIKPGDVIVWEHKNGSGHVMIVEDVESTLLRKKNIKVFEVGGGNAATEGRYVLDELRDPYEENGTVAKNKILLRGKLYRNEKDDPIKNRVKVAIIRFATTSDTVSESAKLRDEYKNLDIAKVITKINGKKTNNQTFVEAGETITYALKITNKSDNTYKGLKISELIDTNVIVNSIKTTKKESDGDEDTLRDDTYNTPTTQSYNKTNIERTIPTLKKDESFTLYYTVQVKTDVSLGTIIKSTGKISNADVGGTIKTSTIETKVGKGLTDGQKSSLVRAYELLKNDTTIGRTVGTDSKLFVDLLYSTAGINYCAKVSEITENLIYSKKNTNGEYEYTWGAATANQKVIKYLYNNFYGLRLTESRKDLNTIKASKAWNFTPEFELNDRARTLTPDMLETGDIIIAQKCISEKDENNEPKVVCENYYNAYFYKNAGLYRFKKAATSSSNPASFEEYTGDKLEKFLRNLIGKKYIIIRPYTTGVACS